MREFSHNSLVLYMICCLSRNGHILLHLVGSYCKTVKGNWYNFRGEREIDIISGETILSKLFCFLLKVVYSKRKEFAPLGSKFFPFRVDIFSEGDCCTEKQTGSQVVFLSENLASVSIHLYFEVFRIVLGGLGGSVGCAVRLETRRSRVQPPPRSETFFREIDHEIFLRSFSPFCWFKKGSCQFLAKECAQYWLTT